MRRILPEPNPRKARRDRLNAAERSRAVPVIVRPVPGAKTLARVMFDHVSVVAAIGRGGFRRLKREGDGGTPTGRYRFLAAYYRGDRIPRIRTALPLWLLRTRDGWCDDTDAALYNRPILRPSTPSHETMKRTDRLYDLVLVIDHNQRPRKRNGGSGIFIHLIRENRGPTEGCLALPPRVLRRLAGHVRPGDEIDFGAPPRPVRRR